MSLTNPFKKDAKDSGTERGTVKYNAMTMDDRTRTMDNARERAIAMNSAARERAIAMNTAAGVLGSGLTGGGISQQPQPTVTINTEIPYPTEEGYHRINIERVDNGWFITDLTSTSTKPIAVFNSLAAMQAWLTNNLNKGDTNDE